MVLAFSFFFPPCAAFCCSMACLAALAMSQASCGTPVGAGSAAGGGMPPVDCEEGGRAAEEEELTLSVMGGRSAQSDRVALQGCWYGEYGSPRHLDSRTPNLSVSPEM